MLTKDGKQGIAALKLFAPKTVIPIHFTDLPREVSAASWDDRVVYLAHCETYTFDARQRTGG